jgi:MerR family transcriptional regulator/heat shock protein HspR
MKPDTSPNEADLPTDGEEPDVRYTLDVFAELAGVNPRTVLHYQEEGFIHPVAQSPGPPAVFDAESLRELRRIEYLRTVYQMNEAGLRLVLDLLHENERLRQERRRALR